MKAWIRKKECNVKDNCAGWNDDAFDGDFGSCSGQDPFFAWKEFVKVEKYRWSIDRFAE